MTNNNPPINWDDWEKIDSVEWANMRYDEGLEIVLDGKSFYFKRKKPEVKLYKCGHEPKPVILDCNELSLSAYLDWKDSVGFGGDNSLCWECYCVNLWKKDKKPEVKLPIVFEDKYYEIEVYKECINICSKLSHNYSYFYSDVSLPLLLNAIDAWKKLQEKKE